MALFHNEVNVKSVDGREMPLMKIISESLKFIAEKAMDKLKEQIGEFKKEKIDFIFVVGDDNTDEEIFKYLKSAEKYFTNFGKRVKTFTTVIGKKPSEAKYYFNEVNDCIETLELLIRYNVSDKKENLSTRDLPNFMEGNHLVQPANKRLSMTMNSKLLLPLKQMNE